MQIILEDVNDNAPSLYPTVASVCEDAKDVKVVFGALDKDIHPKQEPFKFELSKQSSQDKVWKLTRINSKSIRNSQTFSIVLSFSYSCPSPCMYKSGWVHVCVSTTFKDVCTTSTKQDGCQDVANEVPPVSETPKKQMQLQSHPEVHHFDHTLHIPLTNYFQLLTWVYLNSTSFYSLKKTRTYLFVFLFNVHYLTILLISKFV